MSTLKIGALLDVREYFLFQSFAKKYTVLSQILSIGTMTTGNEKIYIIYVVVIFEEVHSLGK